MRSKLKAGQLKSFMDGKAGQYNSEFFIEEDPVSIPHLFSRKEDIEISGFLSAAIAWGQRPVILRNARLLVRMMDDAPFEFVSNVSTAELKRFENFVHRTFNGADCMLFVRSLTRIYRKGGNLELLFAEGLKTTGDMSGAIDYVRTVFLPKQPCRSSKHFASPLANSSAKRINMFLRWMVRKDRNGVDFGIWKSISPRALYCPLDVHSGRVARKLGLLERKQDDWKAVAELTANLRSLDEADPVKYDFALFGLGAYEKF